MVARTLRTPPSGATNENPIVAPLTKAPTSGCVLPRMVMLPPMLTYDFRGENQRGIGQNALLMYRWEPVDNRFIVASKAAGRK